MKSAHVLASVALLFALSLFLGARGAHAHERGMSLGDYVVSDAVVVATLTFAQRDVSSVPSDTLAKGLVVRGDDVVCPAAVESTTPFENDAVRIVVRATCATRPRGVVVEALFLAELPFGHRHIATANGVRESLTLSRRTFAFVPGAEARGPSRSFLSMGAEHILTGYDHLVFLFGLVLVATRARELLLVVTAFTVGHSLSLALATLGVVAPSPRVVEPLIALSIVYVGVENLRGPKKRWRITLPFGFVHGFGFASALAELSLPRAELPVALAWFNVGVELGQLAVLAPLVPLVGWLHRKPWFHERGVRLLSVLIAVAGFSWFIARVLFG